MKKKAEIQKIYPLTPMQEGMLYHTLLDPDSPAYFQQISFYIKGNIDIQLFEQSFNILISRYDVLRTIFNYQGAEEPIQIVLKERSAKVFFEDISALPDTEQAAHLVELKKKDRERGFDLTKDLLIRAAVLKTGGEQYQIIWSFHHILMDGWCISIVFDEFLKIYQLLKENQPFNLPQVYPYSDFIKWLEQVDREAAFSYWETYLEDYEEPAGIPKDYQSYGEKKADFQEHYYTLSPEVTHRLEAVAKSNQVSLSTVFQTIWGILLQKYTHQSDVVFGLVVSGRPAEVIAVDKMIGLFINTIPVRIKCEGERSFDQLIKEVQRQGLEAGKHSYISLAKIQTRTSLKQKLFENIVVFENFPIEQRIQAQGARAESSFQVDHLEIFEQTNYDLTLIIYPGPQTGIKISYNSLYYSRELIENIQTHLVELIGSITQNPSIAVNCLSILSAEEKRRILEEFNNTGALYPKNKTLHRLFEEQVERTPENIALIHENRMLSYRELNEKANRLARKLKESGIVPDDIVGIMAERSPEMMIGMMAVLKAGGAYLPLDPDYPQDRISYMLEDSEAKVLLVDSLMRIPSRQVTMGDEPAPTRPVGPEKPLVVINLKDEASYTQDGSNLEESNQPSDLAYIIYTSGTTGKSKGAMIEHRNVVRLMFNDKMQFDFSAQDVWTMFHSFSFDFSVWEIYGALLYGGKLVIVPKIVAQDPSEYLKLLKVHQVTILNQTPTAFYNLINEELKFSESSLGIRYVIFGGEALKPIMLKEWRKKYPATKLINMYGITETTVHVTFKEITEKEIELNISNIGRPIPTLTAYIMDRDLQLLPIGAIGELCVGGDGVGRGYLKRPELTAQRFVSNPYRPQERLYRSGDLAKFLPDGEMEYHGRIDHQVKIRGHRIELGEIESVILKYGPVKEVVVLAREDSAKNKYLCAYYVTSDASLTVAGLREYLGAQLPGYMIPAYFVALEKIPMTVNNKVDRKALPEPGGFAGMDDEYEAPRNEVETKLEGIWREVLNVEQAGINGNFFNLGGDSIKAITLVSKMNRSLGVNLLIKDMYQNQTIKELSQYLKTSGLRDFNEDLTLGLKRLEELHGAVLADETQVKNLPADYEDFYPLSSIQQGMVFFTKLFPEEPIYHDQYAYLIKFDQFDIRVFNEALRLLIQKHSILRTTFSLEQFQEPLQIVHRADSKIIPEIQLVDLSGLAMQEQEKKIKGYLEEDIKNKFKFDNSLLWRMRIFKLGSPDYCMCLSFQHAALDGWSVANLWTELLEIFQKRIQGEAYKVRELKCSYKDYVAININRKVSESVREYWKECLQGYSRNKLPFNISNKKINRIGGSRILRRNLESSLLKNLEQKAQSYQCTLQDICLSAHVYLLGIITTDKDIVTGVVTHDRPSLEGSDQVLGCFLNTIPMRIKVDTEMKKAALVDTVKKQFRKAKGNELFLVDIAEIIGESGYSGNPVFDTLLNYTDFHVFNRVEGSGMVEVADKGFQLPNQEMTNTLFDLEVSRTLGFLSLQIKYSPDYLYDEDIETCADLYVRILEEFASGADEYLRSERLLTPAEIKALVYDFNQTQVDYAREKTMHQLFEEQAARTPNGTALILGEETITYGALNEKANQLGRLLMEKGVKSGDHVALMTERGIPMIVAMLAILKCGGCYVPIDPDYPMTRKEYIATNSRVTAILVDGDYGFPSEKTIAIQLDSLNTYSTGNLDLPKDSRDLAYVIYTSGSTGVPKGVMIEHHSAVNLITWVNREYQVGVNDKLLFITSMCFDLSVYDIFGILAAGGQVVIARKDQVQNPEELKELLTTHRITFWDSVPSTMNFLVNYCQDNDPLYRQDDLRLVFMSGDWIPVVLPARLQTYFPKARPISLGGATEGTVWSIYSPIREVTEFQTSIPYGRPLDNNYFYILDRNLGVVPKGVAGELYIGGVGVARGYMNDEGKTDASFLKNRFVSDPRCEREGMMYKTGDLGRMLPDNNIEFLGRMDYQVKIRGYRVELGEIESKLLKHPAVKEAVAVDKTGPDGNKFLCAYIVWHEEQTVAVMREYLLQELPDYMIPTYFIGIEQIPVNQNGKIDRKALPEPEGHIHTGVEYVAPRDEVETELAAIWQEILGVERIGVYDNFFELGGHSLKATTLVSRIHKQFNVEIPLREAFTNQTVAELGELIKAKIEQMKEVEELLSNIENMSEEEVARLLAAAEEEERGEG